METCVRAELAKRDSPCFYFNNSGDCDFVVETRDGTEIIQVCYELTDDNRKREFGGAIAAARRTNAEHCVILTHDQQNEYTRDDLQIAVRRAWQWALDPQTGACPR